MNNESIQIKGSEREVIEKLHMKLGISKQEAADIFSILLKEQDILNEDEIVREIVSENNYQPGIMQLLTYDKNYYINVSVATVFLAASLLGGSIGNACSTYLTFKGTKRPVEKIDEESGMKCILLEVLRSSGKKAAPNVLEKFRGQCCNHDLKCKYRKGDSCFCKLANVNEIMEQLANRGILIKQETYYQYSSLGKLWS